YFAIAAATALGSAREDRREVPLKRRPPQGSAAQNARGPAPPASPLPRPPPSGSSIGYPEPQRERRSRRCKRSISLPTLLKRGSTGSPTTFGPTGPRSAPSAQRGVHRLA